MCMRDTAYTSGQEKESMFRPLVSIVIPAYNASNYLADAINSALNQTYKNIEIVVINDGSCDNGATRAVALEYGSSIHYYEKENGGCASALNYGIEKMHGDYFSWLSHDDLYLPTKIEALLQLVSREGCKASETVLGCNDLIMDPKGTVKRNLFQNSAGILSPVKSFDETLNKKTFNGCGLLIPKEVLMQVGGFLEEYKHLLDRELWMRIAAKGYSFCFDRQALVISRVHNQQITIRARESLYEEEAKLIQTYSENTEYYENKEEFLTALCCFAYKRKHYGKAKTLSYMLKQSGALNMSRRIAFARYSCEGVMKSAVRDFYKAQIRRR